MPKEYDLYRGWYSSSGESSYRENGGGGGMRSPPSTPDMKEPASEAEAAAGGGAQPSSTLGQDSTIITGNLNGKVQDDADETSSDYHLSAEYASRNAELEAFYGLDDTMQDLGVKNQQTIMTDEETLLARIVEQQQQITKKPSSVYPTAGGGFDRFPNLSTPLSLHVDEPCTAMSVSPSGRDVVLASRRGIYIIDLHDPFSPPRWLNHLTSWEVADVQWSPHASKPTCIVSTSNQKAIVWNVGLPSYCAVEHVLHGHERAITDINFHAFDPERLATCSVDTFVHCWDLRTAKSPVISFSDFRAAATQVKWNRCNEHVIASCHDRFVRIWDDRMGARPVYSFEAHKTKITGLDFNRFDENKFITCSIDKTIKFWNLSDTKDSLTRTIHTTFPVTKARHTPFGDGCLVIPEQDFDNAVCLIDNESTEKEGPLEPVHIFRGHQSQVKEALWRYSGGKTDYDDRKFQLITWSKDHDLRLWPIDDSLTRAVHHVPGSIIENRLTRRGAPYVTYRREPKLQYGMSESATNSRALRGGERTTSLASASENIHHNLNPSGISSKFMTGPSQMKLGINHLNWMAGVRVGRSAFAQQPSALPNPQSESMDSPMSINSQDRSMASSQFHHIQPQGDRDFVPENLGEEVSSIGHKFPRITFEKISISTGSCVVCLHGPWGPDGEEGDLIFMRVAISFPPQYPSAGHAPKFSIESNDELGLEKINEITNQLDSMSKAFTDHGKFCLEPCLRLLLGDRVDIDQLSFPSEIDQAITPANDEDVDDDVTSSIVDSEDDTESKRILSQLPGLSGGMYSSSESSEEDVGAADDVVTNDYKTRSKIISSHYDSTPIPRLCGGSWTLTGKLVCFFPAQQYAKTPGNKPTAATTGSAISAGRRMLDPHGSNAARFEAFGRFGGSHGIHNNKRNLAESDRSPQDATMSDDDADGAVSEYDDEDADDETTDSSDEIFQQGKRVLPFRLNGNIRLLNQPLLRTSGARSADLSESHLSFTRSSVAGVIQKRNHVTIRDYAETLLNLHFNLAKEYMIPCGSGRLRLSKAALHNSRVAARYNLDSLSYSWQIIRIILSEDKDNSIELTPVEDSLGIHPKTKNFNNLIWGGHPMGSFWIVPKLFDYYSSKGDVQMLGMMACFFSEAMAATSDSTIRNRCRATAKFNERYSTSGDCRAILTIFSGNIDRFTGGTTTSSTAAGAGGGASSRSSVRGRTITTRNTSCRSDLSEPPWQTARRRRSSNTHMLPTSSKPVSNAASIRTVSQDDLVEQQHTGGIPSTPGDHHYASTAISSLSGLLSTSPERLTVGGGGLKRPYASRSLIGINGNSNGDYSQQLQTPTWQTMQSNNSSNNISTNWQQQQQQQQQIQQQQSNPNMRGGNNYSSPEIENNRSSPKPRKSNSGQYKGVNLMLINQDLYDYGLGAPLLTNRMFPVDETSGRIHEDVHLRIVKYKYCRKNYANILDAWALNVQRAEVCSFDSDELEANIYEIHGRYRKSGSDLESLNNHKKSAQHAPQQQQQQQQQQPRRYALRPIVELGMRCSGCGMELDKDDYDFQHGDFDEENENQVCYKRCPSCHKINKWLICVLCNGPIKGLYSPCIACEHAVHTHCGREWFISNKQQECPLGCGCNCIQEVNGYEYS